MVSIPRFIAQTSRPGGAVFARTDAELAGEDASVLLKGVGENLRTAGKIAQGASELSQKIENARARNRAEELVAQADQRMAIESINLKKDSRSSEEFEKRSRELREQINKDTQAAAGSESRLTQRFVSDRLKGITNKAEREHRNEFLTKRIDEEIARFGNVTAQLKQRIVGAGTQVEADLATADLREHIRSNTGTVINEQNAAKLLRSSLQDVRFQRALIRAQGAPEKVLNEIRAGKGVAQDLDPEQQRKLQVFAENRASMLVNRRLSIEKQKEREVKALRDQVSVGFFKRMQAGEDVSQDILKLGVALGFERVKDLSNLNKDLIESRLKGNKTDSETFKRVKEAVEFGFDPLTGKPATQQFIRDFRDNLSASDYGSLLSTLRARQDRLETKGETQREKILKEGLGLIKTALGIDALGLRRDETKDFLLLEATRQFRERVAADPKADPIQVAREVAFRAALAVGKRLKVRTEVVASSTGYFNEKLELDKERLAKDVSDGVVTRRFAMELEQLAQFLAARDALQKKATTNEQVTEEDVNQSGWVTDQFERANKLWNRIKERLNK